MSKQEKLDLYTSKYEVEITGCVTSSRTYFITAESQEKAEEIALAEVDADWEIPDEWKCSAEICSVELDSDE